ncbi:LacI family DNA-binding transcriptional regulator [Puniceibacterium sediminis]|uniref:Transcriptional regulator, LacI family n=1 Tax=Puniceibacterium sediminis TaxID=1608407 RepID=A0A238XPZ1_9RHOB|nr:LacI family DNA-binding transcriptional regulator [Puniceibacterium sediminis]SNR60059.1 transcriptional regulator, LacI family [Puniceibacterium sediminis]
MNTRRPTILDVARAAGVSKSTVSLVVRGSPTVKEDTAKQVREAMAATGYVYNRAAANLRKSSVGLIGLVINDLRNPFFTEFATSVQMALSAQGYATVISNSDEDGALQAQMVSSMIEHGVSAFIISPAYGQEAETFDQIARAGIPCLQVLRQVDPRGDLFPFATFDFARGGLLATQHLIEQGARNIAFVGGLEDRAVTTERMSGYLEALIGTGVQPTSFHGRATRAFGAEIAEKISRETPEIDAAVCFNDQVALGLLSGFARLGRRVGEDFRIVGFDDIEECNQVWPRLSSVDCDIAQFGRDAAAALLDWVETGQRPPALRRAPVSLAARETSLGIDPEGTSS